MALPAPAAFGASAGVPLTAATGSDGRPAFLLLRLLLLRRLSAACCCCLQVEWCGWALVVGSLPAAAFALFTFCNLAPRGWRHHQW